MSLDEIRQNYIKKAENIRQSGINPYPNKARRDFFIAEATEKFDELSNSKKEIYLVGRIKLLRPHGGSCFAQIEDAGAKIQIYFKKDILSEKYDFFLENWNSNEAIAYAEEALNRLGIRYDREILKQINNLKQILFLSIFYWFIFLSVNKFR